MPANDKSNRPLVIASVMSSMAMTAFEATIVATAMPQIVAHLGGLSLYSWVFSSYLLAQTAMTVIFGKLADLYGRRPIALAGIAVFLLGSILAGFAWSMPAMIVFRLMQGVGAGAIQPANLTIVADLYPVHERGKVQGYLASVWAIAAVIGPMMGGLIIRELSWSWIFWINIPIGLAAAAGFVFYLKEDASTRRPKIDIAGAALFTVSVSALMIALTDISGMSTALVAAALVIAAVFAVLFVWQERRAPEPMISFALWGRRPIAVANSAAVLSGMALMGITSFLPMYVQGVLHRSPIVAGLALTMVMFGWPVGATIAVRLLRRLGPRPILITGALGHLVGAGIFVFLTPDSSPTAAAAGSLIMGLGMGLFANSALLMIQAIVDPSDRGSATASNLFSRNLGSTLGAALFGAVLNFGLAHAGGEHHVSADELKALLTAPEGVAGAASVAGTALQHSLHLTFMALLAISACLVALTTLVPKIAIGGARKAAAEAQGEPHAGVGH
ncbi:MAG: major facilitator superfamily 1 [Betaproteobacteria bacterium]|nr:major facilitator superfamily 1 [Betaproteobacteria bacterium]